METEPQKNCCCQYGAAVSGEWPELQCFDCEIHTDPIMATVDDLCRRHKKIAIAKGEFSDRSL